MVRQERQSQVTTRGAEEALGVEGGIEQPMHQIEAEAMASHFGSLRVHLLCQLLFGCGNPGVRQLSLDPSLNK